MSDHEADADALRDPSRPDRRPQVRSACGWLDAPTRLECDDPWPEAAGFVPGPPPTLPTDPPF